MTTADQWREAAKVLREHANKFEAIAAFDCICGVTSLSGPNGEPLGCGWKAGHSGPHSWSTLPTFVRDGSDG